MKICNRWLKIKAIRKVKPVNDICLLQPAINKASIYSKKRIILMARSAYSLELTDFLSLRLKPSTKGLEKINNNKLIDKTE
jgi:hypothetical protein